MAYEERLFERIRDVLERRPGWTEKNMFGGRAYVLNGYAFIGAVQDGLIVRCGKEDFAKHLDLKHCSAFRYGGKLQPGWVLVSMDAKPPSSSLAG